MRYLLLLCLLLCSCANKEVPIVVEKPEVTIILPTSVNAPDINLSVIKDENNNTLYSFDENNFVKLKKMILDLTKYNELSREVICFHDESACKQNKLDNTQK